MMMRTKKTKVPITMKQIENAYFWLGQDGDLEGVTLEEFEKRQREWKGPRPSDYIEGL